MNQDVNLALDGAEWPASRHVHFIPGGEPSLGDWLGFRGQQTSFLIIKIGTEQTHLNRGKEYFP